MDAYIAGAKSGDLCYFCPDDSVCVELMWDTDIDYEFGWFFGLIEAVECHGLCSTPATTYYTQPSEREMLRDEVEHVRAASIAATDARLDRAENLVLYDQ